MEDVAADRGLTPKTAKGNRTRAHLKAAARTVFGRVGYSNARVTDITDEAQLSAGSFYRYFVDKEDVLLELLQNLLDDIVAFARDPWEPSEPLRSVRRSTEKYLSFYSENRDLYGLLIEVAHQDQRVQDMWSEAQEVFYRRIARMLRRARSAGLLRDDVDPDLAAILLGGMTEHYAYMWYVKGRAADRGTAAVVRQLSDIWAHGVFQPDADAAVT